MRIVSDNALLIAAHAVPEGARLHSLTLLSILTTLMCESA